MKENIITGISVRFWGRRAMFTDPVTKIGGEKCSYHLPTYEAIKGMLDSIYWKPTFTWVVDSVRVMNPITTEVMSVKLKKFNKNESDLYYYTYLRDVEYQVKAHIEWNMQRPDLAQDRNYRKHYEIANRYIKLGGKLPVYLGTSDCDCYVEPCEFGRGEGFYDNTPELSYGIMYHGIDYPSQTGTGEMYVRLAPVTMTQGIVNFMRPEECKRRYVRKMPVIQVESQGVEEEDKYFRGCSR